MFAVTSGSYDAYPVEVSSWDDEKNFFVEKTELRWSELAGKHVLLQRRIPPGTLVFLRLLDPVGLHRSNPVPYRTEQSEDQDADHCRIRLLPAKTESTSN